MGTSERLEVIADAFGPVAAEVAELMDPYCVLFVGFQSADLGGDLYTVCLSVEQQGPLHVIVPKRMDGANKPFVFLRHGLGTPRSNCGSTVACGLILLCGCDARPCSEDGSHDSCGGEDGLVGFHINGIGLLGLT
jgi:hypothetical protein